MAEETQAQATAATGSAAAAAEGTAAGGKAAEGKAAEKTYTEQDVAGLKAAWEKEMAGRLEEAKKSGASEAERLAKMSAEEKLQEQVKTLKAENETLKAQDAKAKLEAEAAKILEAQQLPQDFKSLVMADSAEAIKSNIDSLKAAFTKAVQSEVENRLKGKPPTAGTAAAVTAEDEARALVKKVIGRGR